MNVEAAVKNRYSSAARKKAYSLCCPIEYNQEYLKVIPKEVLERDYGCGDPSQYLKEGETVLDLGSGTGKICFIATQVVGKKGKVIGVDMTDEMLEIARRNALLVAEKIGYSNVEFKKGRIQDLGLDLEKLDEEMQKNPGTDSSKKAEELRISHPLISSDSIDVVVSNCVLNLVEQNSKRQLFEEIFRVLQKGGRAVISDIVSDQKVPEHLQKDPELWSGCISGAMMKDHFLKAFSDVGFGKVELIKLDCKPWQTVEGIEFRSATVQALKEK